MKKFFAHARTYIFRGLLAIIPLVLSFFVLQFLYSVIDQRVIRWLDKYVDIKNIPGLGILLILVLLYFIGLGASNVLGRKVFSMIEQITTRIPLIKSIYQIGKQFSSTVSLSEQQLFKRVVLVNFFNPGAWTIGFVTGSFREERSGEEFLRVFIPTVPNPTSGYIAILPAALARDPGLTVEEGMKMVISGGIIAPESFSV